MSSEPGKTERDASVKPSSLRALGHICVQRRQELNLLVRSKQTGEHPAAV